MSHRGHREKNSDEHNTVRRYSADSKTALQRVVSDCHLLVVNPNVCRHTADEADEFLTLDYTNTNVPVTSPTGRL